MKIYTCAFSPFLADESFFSRDSGLLCRTLQTLGVTSKVIMPHRDGEDPDDVLRVNMNKLRDVEWWKSLNIDGVIFIAWGIRSHTKVIQAARRAGIRTCALFDLNGDPYPYGDFLVKPRLLWQKSKFVDKFPMRLVGTLIRLFVCGVRGATRVYSRSVQINAAHFAAFQTPSTMDRCLRASRLFPWIKKKSTPLVMGYAIPEVSIISESSPRRQNVVAAARWDATRHKRPYMLMRVFSKVAETNNDVSFDIYGRTTSDLESWHSKLEVSIRQRIILHGVRPSAEVMQSIRKSQILYCPSVEEGVPLPVIEALCCGCTVVGLEQPSVPGLYWGISEGHGTGAKNDSVSAHASAILTELSNWSKGARSPDTISNYWRKWFSCENVAERFIKLLSK